MFKAVVFTDQRPLTRDQINARTMRFCLTNLCAHALWLLANGEPAETLIDECCRLSAEAQAFDPLPLN